MLRLLLVEVGGFQIRVCQLVVAAIESGVSHHIVDNTSTDAFLDPFEALKPHQGHAAGTIVEGGFYAGGVARGDGVQVANATAEDEVGLVRVEIVEGADVRTVHHTERKIMKEVAKGVNVKFFGENVGLGRSNAFQI